MLFSQFRGLGSALKVDNQTLAGLNAETSIARLRALLGSGDEPRVVRLGFGQNLSVQVSAVGKPNDQVSGATEEDSLDRLGLLLMLNLHPKQEWFEMKAIEMSAKLDVGTVEEVLRKLLASAAAAIKSEVSLNSHLFISESRAHSWRRQGGYLPVGRCFCLSMMRVVSVSEEKREMSTIKSRVIDRIDCR